MERPRCPDCGGPISLKLGVCLPCGRPYSPEIDGRTPDAAVPAATTDAVGLDSVQPWYDDPTPWRRYFARLIDVSIAFFIVEGVLLLVTPSVVGVVSDYIVHAGALLLWIPTEAAFLALSGTTPGKALLGLRVRQQKGGALTYNEGMERAGRVWMAGLALGIPLANVIAMGYGYHRLTSRGVAWWDDELGMKVEGRDVPFGRIVATLAIVAAAWAWGRWLSVAVR